MGESSGIAAFFEEQGEEDKTVMVDRADTDTDTGADTDAGDGDKGADTKDAIADQDSKADDANADDGKTADADADVDPSGDGEGAADDKDAVEDKKSVVDPRDSEIASLRVLLKEQSSALDDSKDKFKQLEQKLVDEGTLEKGELDSSSSGGELNAIRAKLETLEEVVKMNPKFEDYDVVVSTAHYDSTIEAMARLVQQEDGGTLTERIKDVEAYVWNMPNPFTYLYETIKGNHPAYKAAAVDVDAAGKVKPKVKPKDKKEVSPSLSNLDGGGGGKGGWTAVKIDALAEEEISTVPPEVYEKYMQGDLA